MFDWKSACSVAASAFVIVGGAALLVLGGVWSAEHLTAPAALGAIIVGVFTATGFLIGGLS